mgnify:CR=1 FL=1|jgi:serine/threonine protein kinase
MTSLLDRIFGSEPEVSPKPIENDYKQPKDASNEGTELINQGAYGCIFRPGIECSGKQLTSKKYITKIQKYKKTSIREVEFGKKIKNIPGYSRYYAPILETCDITVNTLKNDTEAKKCDFINTLPEYRNKTYESNRIRYIGNQTLGEYLVKETSNIGNVESYFRKLINTHTTLLKGITNLNRADILHFDIKENNIMCRKKSGAPVIIDFGLSIDTSKLTDTTFPIQDAFFSYTANYEPWCLDIAMISYMAHKTQNADVEQPTINAWRNNTASVDSMNEVIREYIEKNQVIAGLLSPNEVNIYKESMQTYYTPLIEGGMFNVPIWGNVYDELVKYHPSWDNYSVAVMFLRLLTQLGISEYAKEFQFIENYMNILKSIVMMPPDKRQTAIETSVELKKSLSKITRKGKAKIGKLFTPDFQNREKYNARFQQISQSKKESVRVDDNLLIKKEKNIQKIRKDKNIAVE